jgi:hypothetical protein
MTWSHPVLGTILALARRYQPTKVWKHLYDPAERWKDLAPFDPNRLHEEAVAQGCPPFRPSTAHPPLDWRVQRLLQRHHDLAYEPAYGAELASPDARWSVKLADLERWVARTPRAVIVVVARTAEARVVTAYRPLPPLPGVGWDDEDFQRQADYVFEKETGMEPAQLAQDLQRLARAGAASPRDAWWLALAVGRGRARLARDPALREPLAAAEAALAGAGSGVRAEVGTELRADDLLDRLADGLKEERPEDAERALSDIEDALIVFDTLGLDDRASELLNAANSLVTWAPPEFVALGRQAALREAELGAGSAAAMWVGVAESLLGAQVREVAPVRRPTSTLVDSLVPEPSLLDRIAAWADRGSQEVRAWASAQLGRFDVQAPVPVMGQRAVAEQPWTLVGSVDHLGPWFRAFVVDLDYPAGHDVTALLGTPGGTLWNLEHARQEAHLVIVSAAVAVPGEDLGALLVAANDRQDAVVLARRFTRPS